MNDEKCRVLLLVALVAAIFHWSSEAEARKYGSITITQNTVLNDHQFGSVTFGAPGIELDCAGHQVHISSYSKTNCLNNEKCGVVMSAGSKLRNCEVIGGFNTGVYMPAVGAEVLSSHIAGAKTGIYASGAALGVVRDTTVVASHFEGIYIRSSDYFTLDGVVSGDNGQAGVKVIGSELVVLNDVVVGENGSHGIELTLSDFFYAEQIVAYRNFGGFSSGSSEGTLFSSEISLNAYPGGIKAGDTLYLTDVRAVANDFCDLSWVNVEPWITDSNIGRVCAF